MAQSRQQPQQQAQPADDGGLPPDLRVYTPFPFKGQDSKGSPIAIEDTEFAWLENVMWIGEGQLALLPSNALTALFTAAGGLMIVGAPQFYELTSAAGVTIQYAAVFLSDGSAFQISLVDGGPTTIGPPGTFDVTQSATVAQWAATYLLIGTKNSYYIFDGALLYKAGTLGPIVTVTSGGNGSYVSPPTVTISGGSGVGATATSAISNGYLISITMTNPGSGYAPTDLTALRFTITGGGIANKLATGTATIGAATVQAISVLDGGTGYTNQPAVTISGGGGAGATAVASGVANSITAITVVTPGTGFTSTPTVTVAAPAGGGNTATADAILGYNGISSIAVTDAGNGYRTTPTVVVIDPTGNGSGCVAKANMSGTTVSSVTIVNPGQNYSQAVVTFVGGNPAVATASGSLMPQNTAFPVAATDIEIFKSRVWMVNGTHRFVTAPGSVTDFAASDGGVISQNTDAFLSYALYGVKQSNGFIYEFGDSSVNSISNPTTTQSGSVATTTFAITNVDPQIGCPWPATIQPFGQSLVFANTTGIYAIRGGTVEKISIKLDDLFSNLPVQPVTPSAGIVTLFGIKCYALSLFVLDPFQQANRQLLLCWDGFRWFIATQDIAFLSVGTFTILNGPFSLYLYDSTRLVQCFTRFSATLPKKIVSKFYGAESIQQFKQALRFYFAAELPSGTMQYTVTIHGEKGDIVLPALTYPDADGPAVANAYGSILTPQGCDAQGATGRFLGWTLSTSTSAAATIDYMGLGYHYIAGYYS